MTKHRWSQLAALAGLVASGVAFGAAYDPGMTWNMPRGVTEISGRVYDLHMLIFWVCVGIGVVVFGAMFYSVFAHRRSRHPKPADFHESTSVEIMWTIVPFAILVLMAIPAANALIQMEDMRGAQMSVKVTGYQWKWHYDYVDKDVSFYSTLHADSNHARQLDSGIDPTQVPNYLLEVDNRLVLPVRTKIRFLITANDVIHAWWVPDLAVKKDAIPGYVNEMWTSIDEPGIYRGVCAELCGRDHGFRPVARACRRRSRRWSAARSPTARPKRTSSRR
jgi:cytochrome c oxidase subunit 2